MHSIAVVGAGVMGEAIVSALLQAGIKSKYIKIREKRRNREEELIKKYEIQSGGLSDVNVIILAIKPQDLESTLNEISDELMEGALIISILAGVSSSRIEDIIGQSCRVVRIMTNTPIQLGTGMSCITPGKSANLADIHRVKELFSESGSTLVIDESLMDAVTATSGSGPAYFFGFVEAMIEGAKRLGLEEENAKFLVSQTLFGAAKMVSESGKDAKTLRENVTSPNGTTAAALAVFDSNNWHEIVFEAMKAARDRSQELSN